MLLSSMVKVSMGNGSALFFCKKKKMKTNRTTTNSIGLILSREKKRGKYLVIIYRVKLQSVCISMDWVYVFLMSYFSKGVCKAFTETVGC